MWPIFRTKLLIFQSKINSDENIFVLVKSQIFKTQNQKNTCKGFYGNQEFHVPFWAMIYSAFKLRFNAIVSFRYRISIARKSWRGGG